MIRLLKVTYRESAKSISSKINEYVNNALDAEDFPAHTELGDVLSLAAEMKEYAWEPYQQDCIYIITRDPLWEKFETSLLQRVGVQYEAEDVLDQYYSGVIKLPKLRRRIQKYLRFWLTSDEVLDKITQHGMSSLTPLDYTVLKAASEKKSDI